MRDLHITRLMVTGNDPPCTAAVLGNSHTDLGSGLPDALSVVAEMHVVGDGDGFTVVQAVFGKKGLHRSRVRTIGSAYVEVLTVFTLEMLE